MVVWENRRFLALCTGAGAGSFNRRFTKRNEGLIAKPYDVVLFGLTGRQTFMRAVGAEEIGSGPGLQLTI